jgi:hypothetical protein
VLLLTQTDLYPRLRTESPSDRALSYAGCECKLGSAAGLVHRRRTECERIIARPFRCLVSLSR